MAKRSPRLQFTDEERGAPELKKAVRKADKRVDRLEKAERKIPKRTVKRKTKVTDQKTGKVTTNLRFEEVDRKRPPSKLSHAVRDAPVQGAVAAVHREIRESDDNVGTDAANTLTQTAETAYHTGHSAYLSHKLKPYRNADRAEVKADQANIKALNKEFERQEGFSSNPYSKWRQKQAIKKEYAAAKAGKGASKTVKASETTAKAAKKAAEESKKAGEFIVRHKKAFLILGAFGLILVIMLNFFSSCSVMVEGGLSGVGMSTYPSKDEDMLGAEDQYLELEAGLQEKLDNYEAEHDYDEYHFDLDEITHDPYVLISILTAYHQGEWTLSEVQGTLGMLFEQQYILTEEVIVETRYRTETRTGYRQVYDPATGRYYIIEYEYEVEVPYDYYICNVTLENVDLSHLPIYIMGEDQLSMYSVYMATLGNRPDLFSDSEYIGRYDGDYTDYDVPQEALEDEQFAAMLKEAEKYLGFPYVWGGSNPSTSFDCSGYVSWVINHSGWDVGRLGAQGLYNICTPTGNPQPGDLVFFEKTYDTTGVSHVGIYVGNGMMLHCGDPISYSNLNSSYWQEHFYAYGRLP